MHNNEEYYTFLKDCNLPGGDDLYERVLNVENLYIYGFYENVQHSVRMFFECFTDNICRNKKIQYQFSDEYTKTINYTKTLRHIFKNSAINDVEWYQANDIEDIYQMVNKSSHNEGLEKTNVKTIKENNERLLYIVRNTCIWYYNHVAKTKRKLDNYRLPDILNIKDTVVKDVCNAKAPYVQINKTITERNVVLSQKLKEANCVIKELQNDNINLKKYVKLFSEEKKELENQISSLKVQNNDINAKLTSQNLIKMKYKKLQKKYEQSEFEKDKLAKIIEDNKKQEILINNIIKSNQKIIEQQPVITASHENNIKNKKLGVRTERFYNNVLIAIKGMHELHCYININTLFRFFKGIGSSQTEYCPDIKTLPLWAYYIRETRFEYRYLEQAIDYLLENQMIILNEKGMYEPK